MSEFVPVGWNRTAESAEATAQRVEIDSRPVVRHSHAQTIGAHRRPHANGSFFGLAGGDTVPRPWRLVFAPSPDTPPLRGVLLGVNAHINYDLPQALLAVISDDDFSDRQLMDRHRRDSERIDKVLASRVAAEDEQLATVDGATLLDRILNPLNQLGSKRFLREARQKVWHNTVQLHESRLAGPAEYAVRLAELELLSATKVADLLQPGQVLLRLAIAGFGVTLPPTGERVDDNQTPESPR